MWWQMASRESLCVIPPEVCRFCLRKDGDLAGVPGDLSHGQPRIEPNARCHHEIVGIQHDHPAASP